MNVTVGKTTMIDGKPIEMPIRIVNSGKTPAYDLDGLLTVNLLKDGEQPVFVYKNGTHPGYHFNGKTYSPNSPTDFSWAVLPIFVPKTDPINPILATSAIRRGMQDGSLYIVVNGKITYKDAFGVDHWIKFCAYSHTAAAVPMKVTADSCGPYNDVDKNYRQPN